MNPQQPNYGPPAPPTSIPPIAPEQTPYDFIMNPTPPPRRSLLGGLGGSSTLQRIFVVAGGVAVLLIIIIVLLNVVFGNHTNSAPFIKVAQDQTEIARVAGLAVQQNNIAQGTKNFAITAQLSLGSDQQQLTSFLQGRGVKVDAKTLAALQNAQTDQQLSSAASNNAYDSTFLTIMQTDLGKYQQALKAAYASSSAVATRQLLQGEYDNAGLLLKQLASVQGQ